MGRTKQGTDQEPVAPAELAKQAVGRLDLTDYTEGVGKELAGLRAVGTMFKMAVQESADICLSQQDADEIGVLICYLVEQAEARLRAIEDAHDAVCGQTAG